MKLETAQRLRQIYYGVLAAALLSLPSCAALSAERMAAVDRAKGYESAAWMMACEVKQVDCTEIRRPVVAYTIMPDSSLGMYPGYGGWIVLVNIQLGAHPASTPVIVHEMIHYIQKQQDPDRNFGETRCAREREAFNLTLKIAEKYNLDTSAGGTVPWYVIARQYGCPIQ